VPLRSSAVTISTVATFITSEGGSASASAPVGVYLYNNGSTTIYVGGDDVTTSNGLPVVGTSMSTFYLFPGDALYGISASGTIAARVLKQRA